MKKLNLKCTYRKKGYSLIELVLSIAMLLIITMVLTSLLGVTQKILNKSYINQNTNSDMSYAINYIKDEIESCDYYTYINGGLYFIKKVDNKYNYISYGLKDNQLFRYSTTVDKMQKFNNLPKKGNNALTEEIGAFKLSDQGSYFNIYLKYNDKDKINFKIAKRIKLYE